MTTERPWIVVQAGGEDTHLQSLTRVLCGRELPTQFAVIAGAKSLLQATIELAATLTHLDRVLVVVSAAHAAIARDQIARYPGVEAVVQPRDLDTAPAQLLALARILARDPLGRVVFLPATHFVANPGPLVAAIRASGLAGVRDRASVIRVTPLHSELEDEWIAVGQVTTFWDLAREYLPEQAARFEHYIAAMGTAREWRALQEAYAYMVPASFSHEVLAHALRVAVIPVDGTGWSDWDSPRQVIQSLQGTPMFDELLGRIRSSASPYALAS